jgi:uncharacterized protein YjbI with pentapeptide repeats
MSSKLRVERARRAFANEFERGGQIGPGGNRRYLLGEDFSHSWQLSGRASERPGPGKFVARLTTEALSPYVLSDTLAEIQAALPCACQVRGHSVMPVAIIKMAGSDPKGELTMATEPQQLELVEPVVAEAEPEPLPPTALALADKARDLVAIRDTVVDAASVAAGLWFSYLFVLLYLLVAAGSVTHRDLLLQSPVRLPFLNVDLPLVGFFVLGPLLFLVVHAYVLLHFVLLAGKVGVFDGELRAQIADAETRTRLRRQLPSNIFVQFLAGPMETRKGIVGLFLRLIAQVSLVLGPIALLVFVQLQFLPYHDEIISWWQRIAVVIDLALLWTLWPAIAHGKPITDAWRDTQRRSITWVGLASLIPILLVFSIATFPGEWLESGLSVSRASEDRGWRSIPQRLVFGLRHALVMGDVDFASRKPTSLWSNRLVLPGLSVMDEAKYDTDAKLAAVRETYALRGRNLNGAVLIGAMLRKADFTAVNLNNATLDDADLREAKFDCAVPGDPPAEPPDRCVQLLGASLRRANLLGTDMAYVNLEGASLTRANLMGASLRSADLRGADLTKANLQGADVSEAKLQAAIMERARMNGVRLRGANLTGAVLSLAELRGATLSGATIQATDLQGALVWRADPTLFKRATIFAPRLRTDPDWSAADALGLRTAIETEVPSGPRRDEALKSIARLDPTTPFEQESLFAQTWQTIAKDSPSEKPSPAHHAFFKDFVAEWIEIGCRGSGLGDIDDRRRRQRAEGGENPGSRYLAEAIMDRAMTVGAGSEIAIPRAFSDPVTCPGARAISEEAKHRLARAIARESSWRASHPASDP